MKITIQHTKDYNLFKLHLKNRKLSMNKIKRLAESMKENNLLPYFPVVVNENNVILDGQHRYAAAKMAEVPVYYITSNGNYDIDKVASSNQFQDHWKAHDYVNYWMRSGKKEYKELFNLCKEFGLSVPIVANLHDDAETVPSIRDGSFKFKNKEETIKILSHGKDIGEQHGFVFWKSRAFLRALTFIMKNEKYNQLRMHQKIQSNRSKLIKYHEAQQYISVLEEIYNTNATEQVRFL